ncbi:branched-chain amino acid ABC transporter permease [Aquibacillus halophilus]|uniref:Branched-chain amino acid ABC transporter permease n=1 Tax=Aquibacillus halophilus TaxID=930132 RepID=A0A6A8DM57_9BACI|nr:AzlC family ABC transporter permease [Aquibacillus halophilus]MRH44097.1 branched-chain amino acid ABC transporter permease [Aquibacillus halophilus]
MTSKAIQEKHTSTRLMMIQKGIAKGIPIMMGYLPVALTYGVLAKQAGMSIFEITLMSVLVFAGASQFMGAGMIAIGTGAVEIIIATFVLNFRHFVMSLSFMNRLRGINLKWKVPLSLGLTDETFSVASIHSEEAKQDKGTYFYAALMITAYFSWVFGSFLGGVLGDIIPETLSQSMGVALYAMFIGLLIPSVKKELKFGLIAVIAMLVNGIFSQFVDTGWAIVAGTLIGGATGIILLKEDPQ